MASFSFVNIDGRRYVHDRDPEECPICHAAIQPEERDWGLISSPEGLRGCLKTGQTSQTTHHHMDHGHAEHGFTRLGPILIILRETAVAAKPAKGPLHHPALRQEQEPLGPFGPSDHVEADVPPGPQGPSPSNQIPGRGLIPPEQTQARTPVPQDVQEWHGPVAVLHAGRRDHDC